MKLFLIVICATVFLSCREEAPVSDRKSEQQRVEQNIPDQWKCANDVAQISLDVEKLMISVRGERDFALYEKKMNELAVKLNVVCKKLNNLPVLDAETKQKMILSFDAKRPELDNLIVKRDQHMDSLPQSLRDKVYHVQWLFEKEMVKHEEILSKHFKND